MGNKQSVNNNRFWCHFHKTLSETPENLSIAISNLNKSADDVILDYQTNNDTPRAYYLLQKLDNSVEELFDGFANYQFNEKDLEELTNLCRRLNENLIFQEIREFPTDEKEYREESNALPRFGSQVMPSSTLINMKEHQQSNGFLRLKDMVKQKSSNYIYDTKQKFKASRFGTMAFIHPSNIKKGATIKSIAEIKEIHEMSTNSELNGSPPKVGSLTKIGLKMAKNYSQQDKENAKKEIAEMFKEMRGEYEDQKIDFAHDILKEIKDLMKNENLDKWVDYYINSTIEYKMLMDDIESTYHEVSRVVTELEDEESYQLEKAEENIIVRHKKLPKGKTALKFEAILDISVFDLLTMFQEVASYTSWSPYCKEAKEVKRISRLAKAAWMKWEFPKPISEREGLLLSTGFNRMDVNGSFLILSKTVHNDKQIMGRYELSIPADSKLPRIEVEFSGIELTPLSKNKTIFKFVTIADPKTKMLPAGVVSWAAQRGAVDMFKKLVVTAQDRKNKEEIQKNSKKEDEFSKWLQKLETQYFDIELE